MAAASGEQRLISGPGSQYVKLNVGGSLVKMQIYIISRLIQVNFIHLSITQQSPL